MRAVVAGGVALALISCSGGDDESAPVGSWEHLTGLYPAAAFTDATTLTYVDLDALDEVAGVARPERTDDRAVEEWVDDVLVAQNALRVTLRGIPVDVDAAWTDEVGVDLLDVRQALSGGVLPEDALSFVRVDVSGATVVETVLADPTWGDEYQTVSWNDVEFLDSGVERGISVSVTERTPTRPIGRADQLLVRGDLLVSTAVVDTMHAAIDLEGGSLADQPFMLAVSELIGDAGVLQAIITEPFDPQIRSEGRIVALHLRAEDGSMSSLVVVSADSPDKAAAKSEVLKNADWPAAMRDLSVETVGSSSVLRSADSTAWWTIHQLIAGPEINLNP